MDIATNSSNDTTKLSAIERALAAAKARKAAKGVDASEPTPQAPKAKPQKAAAKAAKDAAAAELTEIAKANKTAERAAAKAAKLAQLAADREARKTAREAAKAEKAAARQAAASAKVPAHMKKVARAAEKLPALRETSQQLFGEITANLSADQIAALALHLQHHNRVAATQRAAGMKLENGDAVRIVGGDPKFLGMTGTVDRAQRIRCYVAVPGIKKPVYLFTSDVEKLEASAAVAASA